VLVILIVLWIIGLLELKRLSDLSTDHIRVTLLLVRHFEEFIESLHVQISSDDVVCLDVIKDVSGVGCEGTKHGHFSPGSLVILMEDSLMSFKERPSTLGCFLE